MKSNIIKKTLASFACMTMIITNIGVVAAVGSDNIKVSGTNSSGNSLWLPVEERYFSNENTSDSDQSIVVDPSIEYQKYAGIGISLDETSISNLWKLDEKTREETIKKLANTEEGAGLDQFRITIGSPDCIEHLPFWSYDVLPDGVNDDFDLKYFSIENDKKYHIIDTIKLIQKYNPDAKFFASAWSAPAWMTTSGTFTGWLENVNGTTIQNSKLRDDCINVFARYYAKTIKAFADEGIEISAITELNEPGMDVVYPAMSLSIEQQQDLAIEIKKVFKEENIKTELWAHDFNFWDWKDPASTETKNYYRIFEGDKGQSALEAIDGIGFHPYWGDATVMKDTYYETGKPVYLTESGGMDPTTILNYFRLNCSSYNGWTQITDQNGGTLHWTDDKSTNIPESDLDKWTEIGQRSGAHWTNRLVTVHTDTGKTTYNNSILGGLGQMAKYLDDGATRIYSSESENGITNVVYCNKEVDGKKEYVMVLGNSGGEKEVEIDMLGKSSVVSVPYGFTTYKWQMPVKDVTGNHEPIFDKVDTVTAKQYSTMSLQLKASDEDNDPLTYYALDVPAGVKVDSKTGLVTWTPGTTGEFELTFAVSDGDKNSQIKIKVIVEKAPVPIPNKIDANINNIKDGDISNFELNASQSGTYMVEINYSTDNIWSIDNQKIGVSVDDGKEDIKNLAVTWSGNGAIILPLEIEQGIHTLNLKFYGTNYHINYINIKNKLVYDIPSKIEAENYSNSYGINLEPQGTGYNISETNTNDWFEYEINALSTGNYVMKLNATTPNDNVQTSISVDGQKVTTLNLENTGGWSNYKTSEASNEFYLEKGKHIIRITIISNSGANIDYLELDKIAEEVDKSALNNVIFEAEAIDLDEYISTNKDKFIEALNEARKINESDEATQEQINEATNALKEAIKYLIKVADKTQLKNTIEIADSLILDDYLDINKDTFSNNLLQAKAVLENKNASQKEVDDINNSLLEFMNSLKIRPDKSKLKELVKEVKDMDMSKYTVSSVKKLKEALDNAESVIEDKNTSELDVNNALILLQDAKQQLIKQASFDELKDLINEIEQMDLSKYKNSELLTNELSKAKELINNEKINQQMIDETLSTLKKAKEGLILIDSNNQNTNPVKQPNKKTNTLQTGDNTHILMNVLYLIAAMFSMIILCKKRNIKNQ